MYGSSYFPSFSVDAAMSVPAYSAWHHGTRINVGDQAGAMFRNPITDRIYAASQAEHMASLQRAADRNQAMEMQKIAAGVPLNANQAQIARDNATRMMDFTAGQNQADRDSAYDRDALSLELEAMRQPFLAGQADAERANNLQLQGLRNAPAFAHVGLGQQQLYQQGDLAREGMANELERAGIAVGPQYANMALQERLAGTQRDVDLSKLASQERIANAALGPENRRNDILSEQLKNQYDLGLKSLQNQLDQQGLANAPEMARVAAMQDIEKGRLGLGFAGLDSGERVAGIQAAPGMAHADALRQGNEYDYKLGQGRLDLGREQLGAEGERFNRGLEAQLFMDSEQNAMRRSLAEAAQEVEREKLAAMAAQFQQGLGFDREKLGATIGQAAADRQSRQAMLEAELGARGAEGMANRSLQERLAEMGVGFDREKLQAGLGESAQERALRQSLAESALGFDREKLSATLGDSASTRAHEMALQGSRLSAAERLAGQGREFDAAQSEAERAFRAQESGLDRESRIGLQQGETDRSLLLESLQGARARDIAQIEAGSRGAVAQQHVMENAMQAAIAQSASPDPIMAAQGRRALQGLMQQSAEALPLSPEERAAVAPPPNQGVDRLSGMLSTIPREAGLPEIINSLGGQAGALAQDPQAVSALMDALAARGVNLATLPEYATQMRENPYPGVFGSDHSFQRYDAPPGAFNWLNGKLGLNETVEQYNVRRGKMALLNQLLQSQGR